jgi:hypothetical protein
MVYFPRHRLIFSLTACGLVVIDGLYLYLARGLFTSKATNPIFAGLFGAIGLFGLFAAYFFLKLALGSSKTASNASDDCSEKKDKTLGRNAGIIKNSFVSLNQQCAIKRF